MNRRYWPATLAALALLLFGSYLAYTQYLVRQLRAEAAIHTRMLALIQEGMAAPDDSASDALLRLQLLLGELNVPLVVTNQQGTIINVQNLPFEARMDDPRGRVRIEEYVDRLKLREQFRTSAVSGTIYYGNPPIVRWLQWVPWLQIGGGVLLVLVAVAVIRSNVRAERERLWAAMARELAHQMGTPLSSLSGWIEVLQLPVERRAEFGGDVRIATVIGGDVERLERVSRRFEMIGKPTTRKVLAIREVIQELDDYFRPRLPRLAKEIDLRVRIANPIPAIEANHVLLVWALENIVKNAIDALAGRGGRIVISATARTDGVQLRIADNGPGIEPEIRARIFEAGVSTKTAGWGVGLALTQRIIEQLHGGRIAVRERRRGGTVFEIHLPAAGHRLRRRWF